MQYVHRLLEDKNNEQEKMVKQLDGNFGVGTGGGEHPTYVYVF